MRFVAMLIRLLVSLVIGVMMWGMTVAMIVAMHTLSLCVEIEFRGDWDGFPVTQGLMRI